MALYKGEKGELTRREKEFLESQEAGRKESAEWRKVLLGLIFISGGPEDSEKKK